MIATFLAYRIINNKLKYKDLPASIKEPVKEALIEFGFGHLATEE